MGSRPATGSLRSLPGKEVHRDNSQIQSGFARENREYAGNQHRDSIPKTRSETSQNMNERKLDVPGFRFFCFFFVDARRTAGHSNLPLAGFDSTHGPSTFLSFL